MTWFDVVKRIKLEGDVVREIFQGIIDRDKRVIVNEETALEVLNAYTDILSERAKTQPYNDEGKNIIRIKSGIIARFKRDPKSLGLKIHGYIRNLYPNLKTARGLTYFIDKNEMNKYISEHPQRTKEIVRRRKDRENLAGNIKRW